MEMAGNGGGKERKVMVAIDESECSHHALMWALDNLGESISPAPLVVFMAQPPPYTNVTYAATLGSARLYCPLPIAPDFANSVQEKQRKLTLGILERAKEICASRGVVAEMVTEVGDPKTTICNVAQKLNASLLILGEHGIGKIKRAFLGSVSNYCMQYAKCPVLVVRKS